MPLSQQRELYRLWDAMLNCTLYKNRQIVGLSFHFMNSNESIRAAIRSVDITMAMYTISWRTATHWLPSRCILHSCSTKCDCPADTPVRVLVGLSPANPDILNLLCCLFRYSILWRSAAESVAPWKAICRHETEYQHRVNQHVQHLLDPVYNQTSFVPTDDTTAADAVE